MSKITSLMLVCALAVLLGGSWAHAGGDTYFNKASNVWNDVNNWDNGLPTASTTNTYVGYDSGSSKTNPAIACIHSSDNSCVASNLYLGKNSAKGTGTLIMDGGVLTVQALNLAYDNGTGIIMQTGGVISNGTFSSSVAGNGSGYASWTISGPNTIVSNGPALSRYPKYGLGTRAFLTISNGASMVGGQIALAYTAGGTGTMTIASGGSMRGTSTLQVGYLGEGTLLVSNATLDASALSLQVGYQGIGHATFADATVRVASIGLPGNYAAGVRGDLTVTGASVVTNLGSLSLGYGGTATGVGSMLMTGGSWWQGGAIVIPACVPGAGVSGIATGTVSILGGTFLPQSDISVCTKSSAAGGLGVLLLSNVTVSTTGTVSVGTGVTNGSGVVILTGTQCLFTVNKLLVGSCGSVTNHLSGYAGGIDIALTNATSFSITSTGLVTLAFEKDPVAKGLYWGLRWLGTNHVAALNTYLTNVPPLLTWNDSALSALYTNQVGVYTGFEASVGYSYVGIKVTKLRGGAGTAIYFR